MSAKFSDTKTKMNFLGRIVADMKVANSSLKLTTPLKTSLSMQNFSTLCGQYSPYYNYEQPETNCTKNPEVPHKSISAASLQLFFGKNVPDSPIYQTPDQSLHRSLSIESENFLDIDTSMEQTVTDIQSQSTEHLVEQTEEQTAEQIVEQTVEQIVEQTVEQMVEQTAEQIVEQTEEQTAEQIVEQTEEQPAEQIVEQTVEQIVEQTVEQMIEQLEEQLEEQTVEQAIEQAINQTMDLENLSKKKSDYTVVPTDILSFDILIANLKVLSEIKEFEKMMVDGDKINIDDRFFQGAVRWWYKDSRHDMLKIIEKIVCSIKWYLSKEHISLHKQQLKEQTINSKKGLTNFRITYSSDGDFVDKINLYLEKITLLTK